MLSRRAMIGKLAAGTAGAAVALVAGGGRAKAALVPGMAMTPEVGFGPGEPVLQRVPEAVVTETAETSETVAELAPVSEPPPWELLRPLALGSMVAHGWRVAELSGIEAGSCVLTLQNGRGRMHRVHLCGNDGRPQGIVYTRKFDLVVMNGGQGDLPTEEGLAQAVAEVAHVVAANEGSGQQQLAAALMPHAERVRVFATSADARLR